LKGPARAPLPPPIQVNGLLAARLDQYMELLLRWNTRIRLVADSTPEAVRSRHLDDSLQLLPLLPDGDGPIGDLGSGAGLPGLVLGMGLLRPVHLVESDRRKAAFLTEAAARLGLSHVHVHAQRAETVELPPLAAVTARALAPLLELLPHAARLLAPNGIAIFPKGRTAEAELTATHADWHFHLERFASRTDPEATILRLSQIERAGTHA
jgi:16S rRNA (guanine527-N7)-methyltransferase